MGIMGKSQNTAIVYDRYSLFTDEITIYMAFKGALFNYLRLKREPVSLSTIDFIEFQLQSGLGFMTNSNYTISQWYLYSLSII